jgi:hypothetical protein
MESRPSGFDMSTMSTASKILLGAGILYLIDLFLPWQRACFEAVGINACGSANGIDGLGILNLLLVIALLAWEGMAVAGVNINAPRALVSAGIAAGIVLFTLLKIIVDNEALYLFAWIGLILALVIGYGGWMRWQEHQATGGTTGTTGMAGTPPPPSGGFTG